MDIPKTDPEKVLRQYVEIAMTAVQYRMGAITAQLAMEQIIYHIMEPVSADGSQPW